MGIELSTVFSTPFAKQLNQESVYGKRDGVIPGLVITTNGKTNMFRETSAYRAVCVHHVSMLPRSDMVKPETVTCCILLSFFNIAEECVFYCV